MIAERQMRDSRWHAPDEEWRSTIMSGRIASRLSAVSASVSPLTTLDVPMAMLSVSALRRFSAISNDVRVRVLGSKNRLTTVLPRSAGTFLIGREPISFIASAVSRMSAISSGRQLGDAEQVLAPQGSDRRFLIDVLARRAHTATSCSSTTSSWPSISCRRTCTLSSGAVGRFLPT